MQLSRMSPQALAYLQDPNALTNKLVIIAESMGAEDALYAIRTFQSEGEYSSLVAVKKEKGWETQELKAVGPTGFIVTMTLNTWHPENETRHFDYVMDEGLDQTGRILGAQASSFSFSGISKSRRKTITHTWREQLSRLNRIEVLIPFAKEIAERFPRNEIRARRDYTRLMELTQACALLHQSSRSRKKMSGGVKVIVAEATDYAVARELVLDCIVRLYQSGPMNCLLGWAKDHAGEFTRKEVERGVEGMHKATSQALIREACDQGFLEAHGAENSPLRCYSYRGLESLVPS